MTRRGRGLKGGFEGRGKFCFAEVWSFFFELVMEDFEIGVMTCNCFSISPLRVVISLMAVSG